MLKSCAEHFGVVDVVELDELYWLLERRAQTKTCKNLYIMTLVSRSPRQIVGYLVSLDKSAETIQKMMDKASAAKLYCMDGYSAYLDVVFPGKHIYNPHNKNDTFTAEGVNAGLRHYIPTLARRSRCFPRKLENLVAVLFVFVHAYNRFGIEKARFASLYPHSDPPFSLINFL